MNFTNIDKLVHQRGGYIAALSVALKMRHPLHEVIAAMIHLKTVHGIDLDAYKWTQTLNLLGIIIMCQSVSIDRTLLAIKALLGAGAKVNAPAYVQRDGNCHSALWMAAMFREGSERAQIMSLLVEHGAEALSDGEADAMTNQIINDAYADAATKMTLTLAVLCEILVSETRRYGMIALEGFGESSTLT